MNIKLADFGISKVMTVRVYKLCFSILFLIDCLSTELEAIFAVLSWETWWPSG